MPDMYIGVIQAGGLGTRMRELTKNNIPKPMISLNGKPMLQWQIESAVRYGVNEFVIIVGHLGEKIREYFGDGSFMGVRISYITENEPLGSAGALYYLKDRICSENFLFIFGDIMFDIDWKRMMKFHENHGGMVTVLVHPNSHPYDSDLLVLDEDSRLTEIDFKGKERDYWYENCVNAGICILNRNILDGFEKPGKADFEKDVLLPEIYRKSVYGYHTTEYVKDAGTLDRFREVCAEQEKGIWQKRCLENKQKCIFIDRDGTINKFRGLISHEDEFELEEHVVEALRLIHSSGYLAIVITNQPVVARGMCGIEDVNRIHRKLQTLLGRQGAYVDDIAFCPHHPDKGYAGENPAYKISCNCRKPSTGLIDDMAEKYNINLENSWMTGDSTVDIQTGVNAGMHTALVKTGQAGADEKYAVLPEITGEDLLDIVRQIINIDRGTIEND